MIVSIVAISLLYENLGMLDYTKGTWHDIFKLMFIFCNFIKVLVSTYSDQGQHCTLNGPQWAAYAWIAKVSSCRQ